MANGGNHTYEGYTWARGANAAIHGCERGPMDMAFKSRVKALHHWIRKREPNRAAFVARELAHQIHAIWRKRGAK